MYHIIYMTTNIINGKFYIGKHSTYNLNDNYIGSGTILKFAIKKYGKENFNTKIILYAYDESQLNELEQQIVDKCFIERPDTYNIAEGGQGGFTTFGYTDLQKLERSTKISKSLTGKKRSEEHNKNNSISNKGKHRNRIFTEETRLKISNAKKGKSKAPFTEEHRYKLGNSMRGKKQSPEHVASRIAKAAETRRNKNK